MQNSFALTGLQAALKRTGLAGLVTGDAVAVRDLEAFATNHLDLIHPVCPIGSVRRNDPIVAITQDVWLWKRFQKGNQFR